MALIRSLSEIDKSHYTTHGEVNAGYCVFRDECNRPVLQIETYGSLSRKIPGKVSQVVQFDLDGIRALADILVTLIPRV